MANGSNATMSTFEAANNPNLTCVQVDDAAFMNANWSSGIDPTATYSDNCVNGECTVVIPDAVFESYLVGNTSINTNNDAYIQCTEAEAFTGQLACAGLGIADLSGIEAFPNVTYIDVYANQITSVDVSNNTEIVWLNINGNSLTSLDVSNNPLLVSLFCNENNLTDLNVSNNPNLQTLYCHINELTSLDVSSCTNLSVFRSQSNSITSLDLSGNSSLQEIRCHNNQLTSLNVANGNNTSVTTFQAGGNSNLTCIQVDDAAYSTANWTSIDSQTSFSASCLTVGIEENNTIQLNAYPNPFNDVLNLNLDVFSGQVEVTILDMTGRVVFTSTEMNTKIQLDLNNLSVGTYALTVRGTDEAVAVSRIVKN
jgi:Leucine-rich repeat (LRR) protein